MALLGSLADGDMAPAARERAGAKPEQVRGVYSLSGSATPQDIL